MLLGRWVCRLALATTRCELDLLVLEELLQQRLVLLLLEAVMLRALALRLLQPAGLAEPTASCANRAIFPEFAI